MTERPALALARTSARGGARRAVLYLRVSSAGQVNTDYDPEGLSIPAQRLACERKLAQMGDVEIVGEYVEPGRSGTNVEGRPAFQEMMQRLKADRDIDYVVVYKVSRLNREWIQAATTIDKIRKTGAGLVSATENIDDTPAGQLTLGLLSAVNAFRSAEDGADIRYKLGEKAKLGGTIGMAPLGYLNKRITHEGSNVAIVVPDPERAPFIQLAFELLASGEFSLKDLHRELAARGLRTRGGKTPAQPVSPKQLRRILTNRYYVGKVIYRGEEYEGRHEALVTPELFEQVQAVMEARSTADERQREHHHYLKGSVWCDECHQAGRTGRLILTLAKGRGGDYLYFFCRQRQERNCNAPYVNVDDVEEKVAEHYASLRLEPDLIERVEAEVRRALADDQASTRLIRNQVKAQLARLDVQEENLLDLAADGDLPKAKISQRLRDIEEQRQTLQASEQQATSELAAGAKLIGAVLALLRDPGELYRRSTDEGRRLLNQALFVRLRVEVGEEVEVEGELREPFSSFVEVGRDAKRRRGLSPSMQAELEAAWNAQRPAGAERHGHRGRPKCQIRALRTIVLDDCSSRGHVVEVMGFEPTASSMRPKRSSQLSYTPEGRPAYLRPGGAPEPDRPARTRVGRWSRARSDGPGLTAHFTLRGGENRSPC